MNLEVEWSTKIQGKKPWPNFAWLQSEKGGSHETSVFLLDNARVGQLSLETGKVSLSFPSLSGVQLALTQASHSGAVVAGLTEVGHMVTWLQPSHHLATYTTPLSAPTPHPQDLQGCHLFVSDSGEQALLVTGELEIHLWELREGLHSEWWRLPAPDDVCLPHTASTNTAIDASFHVHQVLGEVCECDIVFTNKETGETTVANLLLTWKSSHCLVSKTSTANPSTTQQVSSTQKHRDPLPDTATRERGGPLCTTGGTQPAPVPIPVTVDWKSCTVSSSSPSAHHSPPCGRGCYVAKMSPTARVAAVAVNHNTAADTHILFMDIFNEVSVSSPVYLETNCGMTGRTFWVTSLSWSGDGLLLGALTARGSLLLLPRFGPPLKLITRGCGLDMGPTYLLPLHPLITVQNKNVMSVTDHAGYEDSERDPLQQRFSLVTHSHLPLLLCSDGYCLTVLRLPCSLPHLVLSLLNTGRSLLGLSPVVAGNNNENCSGVENESLLQCKPVPEQTKMRGTEGPLTHCQRSGLLLSYMDPGECDSTALGNVNPLEQTSEAGGKKLARVHLLSAWGLLLSAGSFQPGNGVYPMYQTSQSVKRLSSGIHVVKRCIMQTMTTVPDHRTQQRLLGSALSMSFLDQLGQHCHKLVYSLANSVILTMLSGVVEKHIVFTSSSTHTVASVEMYAEGIASSLQQVWKTIQKVSLLVAEIYSLSHNDIQKVFSLPLLALRRICSILSSDLLACNRLAETMLPLGPGSLGLQGREAGLLQGSIATYISEASAVLASISDALVSHDADTDFVLTGCTTNEPLPSLYVEDGVDIERVPHLLQNCNLRQALECVYSFTCGDSGSVPACELSVPGVSIVPCLILADQLVSHPFLITMLRVVAKFMAAFFSTNTAKCPLLVVKGCPTMARKRIEVANTTVTTAITKQNLSSNWTPTHAVELLLLGGLWYEAARFTAKTGDWKRGLALCALYITLSRTLEQSKSNVTGTVVQVEKLARKLAMGRILRELSLSRGRSVGAGPVDQPQPNLHLISGILSVCERGGVSGVCPQVSLLVHHRLWTAVDSLPVRVFEEFQLPSPPLYSCSPSTDDSEEGQRRQALAHLIKSSLQILCCSNSLELCSGWYSSSLVQLHSESRSCPSTRHMPNVDGTITELTMPSLLLQLSTNFPGLGPHNVQCQLALFRELCGVLWLLHVRDEASQLLRQVFQSDLREKASGYESEETVSECALWCARLLPLRHCSNNPSHIEDMLLSVLSELPCNQLLVTLLAQNFPDIPQLGSRRLKMEQILARLRTGGSEGHAQDILQPLSVDYQIMSRAVLEDLGSESLQTFGPLCLVSGSSQHGLELKEKALDVGSLVFEYDQSYLDYLQSFFSSFAKPSTATLKQAHSLELIPPHDKLNNSTTTSSSPFHHVSIMSQPLSLREASEDPQALVTYLYEWSQRLESSHSTEGKSDTPVRIELSLSFLTYCLKLEEEKHRSYPASSSSVTADTSEITITTVTPAATDGIVSSMSAITPLPEDTSSLTAVTSTAQDNVTFTTVTGELSDLGSVTTITPLPDLACVSSSVATVTADTHSATLSDSTLCTEDLGTPRNLCLHPFPLLHLPTDVTLPEEKEYEQPEPLSLSSTPVGGDDLTGSETVARDVSSGQLVSGLDLTDSQSTGEVPSLLTFSVGELGSRLTPHSTADVPPPPPSGCDGAQNFRSHYEPKLLEYVPPADPQEREPTANNPSSPLHFLENQQDHSSTHHQALMEHHEEGLQRSEDNYDVPDCGPSTIPETGDVQKHLDTGSPRTAGSNEAEDDGSRTLAYTGDIGQPTTVDTDNGPDNTTVSLDNGPPTTVNSGVPDNGPPSTVNSDRVPDNGPPSTVNSDRVPDNGPPSTVNSDRVPDNGPPTTVNSDKVPNNGPPSTVNSRVPGNGLPSTVNSRVPDNGPPSTVNSRVPDNGTPTTVNSRVPDNGPPSTVNSRVPDNGTPTTVNSRVPDNGPPSTVNSRVPDNGPPIMGETRKHGLTAAVAERQKSNSENQGKDEEEEGIRIDGQNRSPNRILRSPIREIENTAATDFMRGGGTDKESVTTEIIKVEEEIESAQVKRSRGYEGEVEGRIGEDRTSKEVNGDAKGRTVYIEPSSTGDSPTSLSSTKQISRDHTKELGKTIRSELKKFFKEHQQQLEGMLVDGSDVIENKTPDTASRQVTSVQSADSQLPRRGLSNSSHLSMRHLHTPELLPLPPFLLPSENFKHPHTSQSQNINSYPVTGTQSTVPRLPLLQLHMDPVTPSPGYHEGPQLPPPPVDRRPSTSPLLLLTLDHTGVEEHLLLKLQHIPASWHVFPGPPLSHTAGPNLPLLQCPPLNPTLVETHHMCVPLLPTPTTQRLPPPPPTAGRTRGHGSLPLLLPAQQTTSSYPSLIKLPSPPSLPLLPVDRVAKGIQDSQEMNKLLQQDIVDNDKPRALLVNKDGQSAKDIPRASSTENRHEKMTTTKDQEPPTLTLHHTEADSDLVPKSPLPLPGPFLHPSPISHSTHSTRRPGPPCLPSVQDTILPTDHSEGVSQSEGSQPTLNTVVTTGESGGASLDVLREQVPENSSQNLTSHSHIASSSNNEYRGIPISTTGDGRGSGTEAVVKERSVAHSEKTDDGDSQERSNVAIEVEDDDIKEGAMHEEQMEGSIGDKDEKVSEGEKEEVKESEAEEKKDGESAGPMAKGEVLGRLRQLETQLTTIETRARTVEGELLISNQLLGTIEELETVHKKATGTTTAKDLVSTVPIHHATLPPSPPPTPTSTNSATVVSHIPPFSLPPSESGKQHSSIQPNVCEEKSDNVCPSSLPLFGRIGRQTLRKWVTATRRKKCPEVANQQVAPPSVEKTESRKNIMSRRMDDALTLMEDILSTELPSPSLHPTTYKQSATSRVSSSNRGSNYGGPIMRQTISGTPMNFHAKPMESSVKQSERRNWSSMEGLTPQEQLKMADIMASTELSSVSSGSVASKIDWELVDQLIDN